MERNLSNKLMYDIELFESESFEKRVKCIFMSKKFFYLLSKELSLFMRPSGSLYLEDMTFYGIPIQIRNDVKTFELQ